MALSAVASIANPFRLRTAVERLSCGSWPLKQLKRFFTPLSGIGFLPQLAVKVAVSTFPGGGLVWQMGIAGLASALAALAIFAGTNDAAPFVIISCSPGRFAGEHADTNGLATTCGGKFNLCGYADKAGKQVIAQQFEVALPFSSGLAGVRIDGKFGFVDLTGTLVIPARFDLVGYFSNGLAEVILAGRAGVIDRQGETLIEPNYARAIPFGDDTVLVRDGAWNSMRPDGCESLDDSKSALQFGSADSPSSQYRLWHAKTRSFSPGVYALRYFDDPERRLLWARIKGSGARGKFGLLRSDGTWQTAPEYDDVSPLTYGYATVCDLKPAPFDPRNWRSCGAVDAKGKLIVPFKFDGTFYWQNGLKLVQKGNAKGIVDTSGALLGGRYFDDAQVAEKGDVSLVRIGDEWMGLDRRGRIVANPEDGQALAQCPSGLRAEKRSGKVRFLDAAGKATEPYLFESVSLPLDCDRPTPVQLDGKWGFVDTAGHLLGSPPRYDGVYSFQGGYAAVKEAGKWGIVETKGQYSVTPRFDKLSPDNGVFAAEIEGRKSWVDAHGKEVPEPPRESDRAQVLACGKDGGRFVSDDSTGKTLWGLATADGTAFVQPKYRALRCYVNGLAWVADDRRRMWCQIDAKGVIRDPARCDPNFNGRMIFDANFEKFADDPYESSVLWERALLDYGRGTT
ncbi:WG repeat-containing protein [Mesorhizobium sp. WSM3859]|uniref:WG repeat-containing protein n=1 Tax=Mesorhizobium sp. WSM3859 TaxID=2029402 RepID=UPI000BB03007|nr:WG repeat-containing protein [Mesorhizobium sp. WSM3859]PBC11415.1 hypothetical protein CK230_05050 [Mesorhizobium sp. WSM3859]